MEIDQGDEMEIDSAGGGDASAAPSEGKMELVEVEDTVKAEELSLVLRKQNEERELIASQYSDPEMQKMIREGYFGQTMTTKDGRKKPVVALTRDYAKKLSERYRPMSEETKKAIRLMQEENKNPTIHDFNTGNRRPADFENVEDLKAYMGQKEKKGEMVLVGAGELAQRPYLTQFLNQSGSIRDRYYDIDLKKTPELYALLKEVAPIDLGMWTTLQQEHNLYADEILAMCPLVAMFVPLPRLLPLMIQSQFPAVYDSFTALRQYIVMIKYLTQCNVGTSFGICGFDWLKKSIAEKTLTIDQLKDFCANVVLEPRAVGVFFVDDLITLFSTTGDIPNEMVDKLELGTAELELYPSPWANMAPPDGFVEDINAEYEGKRARLSAQIHADVTGRNWTASEDDILAFNHMMLRHTNTFMWTYEYQIMKILGNRLPPDMRGQFMSPEEAIRREDVGIFKARTLYEVRNHFANIRAHLLLRADDKPANLDDARVEYFLGFADKEDIESFVSFLREYAVLMTLPVEEQRANLRCMDQYLLDMYARSAKRLAEGKTPVDKRKKERAEKRAEKKKEKKAAK
jgi:hypothetical protein